MGKHEHCVFTNKLVCPWGMDILWGYCDCKEIIAMTWEGAKKGDIVIKLFTHLSFSLDSLVGTEIARTDLGLLYTGLVNICWFGLIQVRCISTFRWHSASELMISPVYVISPKGI